MVADARLPTCPECGDPAIGPPSCCLCAEPAWRQEYGGHRGWLHVCREHANPVAGETCDRCWFPLGGPFEGRGTSRSEGGGSASTWHSTAVCDLAEPYRRRHLEFEGNAREKREAALLRAKEEKAARALESLHRQRRKKGVCIYCNNAMPILRFLHGDVCPTCKKDGRGKHYPCAICNTFGHKPLCDKCRSPGVPLDP